MEVVARAYESIELPELWPKTICASRACWRQLGSLTRWFKCPWDDPRRFTLLQTDVARTAKNRSMHAGLLVLLVEKSIDTASISILLENKRAESLGTKPVRMNQGLPKMFARFRKFALWPRGGVVTQQSQNRSVPPIAWSQSERRHRRHWNSLRTPSNSGGV